MVINYQESSKEELIAEIKSMEEKLNDAEKKARVWLEYSPVCTKIIDLDFNLQYMSTAGIKALGIKDVTELYGKPYPFDFFPEAFKKNMRADLEKCKLTGKVVTQEAPVIDLDNNQMWFHATIVPVKDDNDKVEYIIVVSADVTDRKVNEAKLKNYARDLEAKVKDCGV